MNNKNVIGAEEPSGVHTEGVNAGGVVEFLSAARWEVNIWEHKALVKSGQFVSNVARLEPGVRDSEPLVVEETVIAGEEAHHEEEVSEEEHILHGSLLK